MSDAQLLLRSLFKVSCALKDQAEDQGMELTELRDSCELLRLRHEYDQAELETLQAELATRATPAPSGSVSAAGVNHTVAFLSTNVVCFLLTTVSLRVVCGTSMTRLSWRLCKLSWLRVQRLRRVVASAPQV